jgi:hypothetical protein
MNRRLILTIALLVIAGISVLAGVAVFAAGFFTPASARDLPAIRLSELREGEPARVTSQAGAAYVVRFGSHVIAFSAFAPTVNRCAVRWHADTQFFVDDTCLGVRWDARGRYLFGPAVRNLDRHPVFLHDEWVTVDTRATLRDE